MSLLPLDKWARLFRIIRQNGGLFKSAMKLWRMDALKDGKYMGSDSYGNKFYENNYYFLGKSRWVEYNPEFKWEYDASQVAAEWYGWLHYKTDRVPSEDPAKHEISCCGLCRSWMQPHAENFTGTDRAYYPYSTTRARIYVWDGTSVCTRPCMPH